MSKETLWMIIASVAPLIAAVLIYFGLEGGGRALTAVGITLFGLAMLITPAMRLLRSQEPEQVSPNQESEQE